MLKERSLFVNALMINLTLMLSLWGVAGLEYLTNNDFRSLGIYPRTLKGAFGIFTGPFIHDDLFHLFSNSFPLLFLGISIFFFYQAIATRLSAIFYLGTGALVWLVGREAFHIGASGVVYAMIGFLLFSGIFRKEPQSLAISLAFLFLYGGVLQGIFPQAVRADVSWESHLLGLLVGLLSAWYFRKHEGPEQLVKGPAEQDTVNFTNEGEYHYVYRKEED